MAGEIFCCVMGHGSLDSAHPDLEPHLGIGVTFKAKYQLSLAKSGTDTTEVCGYSGVS